MCNKQSERTLWTHPEVHFLLTRSLNNKKNIATLTVDQVWVYGAVYFQFFKTAMQQQCSWTHLVFRPAYPWAHKWAKMHLLFKQRSTGWENENCVGLKLAKTLAPHPALHCAGCMIGPIDSLLFGLFIYRNPISVVFARQIHWPFSVDQELISSKSPNEQLIHGVET